MPNRPDLNSKYNRNIGALVELLKRLESQT